MGTKLQRVYRINPPTIPTTSTSQTTAVLNNNINTNEQTNLIRMMSLFSIKRSMMMNYMIINWLTISISMIMNMIMTMKSKIFSLKTNVKPLIPLILSIETSVFPNNNNHRHYEFDDNDHDHDHHNHDH